MSFLSIALSAVDNNHQRFPERRNPIDDGIVPSHNHINGYCENLYNPDAVKSESVNGHGFLTMDSDTDDDCLFSINLCSNLLASDIDNKNADLHSFSAEYTNDVFQLSMDSDAESIEMASPSQRMWFDLEYEDDDADEEEGDDLLRSLQEEQEEFTMVLSSPSPVTTDERLVCKIPTRGFANLSSGNYTLHHPTERTTSSVIDLTIFDEEVSNNVCLTSSEELKYSHLSLNDKIVSDSRVDIKSDICKSPKNQDDGHVGKKDTVCILSPVSVLPQPHDMLNDHNVSLPIALVLNNNSFIRTD